ncbi:MAG: XdhC family protein [Deltaproteobacteria bacterium]|nr:XdhC family protein [Deltaproteobacteria bacterium]
MGDVFSELRDVLSSGHEAVLTERLTGEGIERTLTPGPFSPDSDFSRLGAPELSPKGTGLELRERYVPMPRLIVFGGGHVSLALAQMATMIDFRLIIYDDRPTFSSPARFPMAERTILDSFENIARNLTFGDRDYAVILTRGHRHDEDCLKAVLAGPDPFYLGMIGSKRRVAIVKKRLIDEGADPERLKRLRSPCGLDIGAITPAEIGLSILAEIIQERRQGEKNQGRDRQEVFCDMTLLSFLAGPRSEDLALATVLSTKGSTPRRAGAKMAVRFDGRTVGSIGGGCSEAEIITKARRLVGLKAGYELATVDMTDTAEEDGMVCGGIMEVLIESLPAN